MIEKILETIKQSNGKISFNGLVKRLGINEDTLKKLKEKISTCGITTIWNIPKTTFNEDNTPAVTIDLVFLSSNKLSLNIINPPFYN